MHRSNVHHILRAIPIAAALVACSGVSDPARASPRADATTEFVTDSASYTLRRESFGHIGRIVTTFTNRSDATVYFVNCHGGTGVELQKRVGDEWRTVWSPVLLSCLSPPITVAAGATHRLMLEVFGGFVGSNYYPQFSTPDIPGTYRLQWADALTSYQDKLPFGEPIPLERRLSNTFTIAVH